MYRQGYLKYGYLLPALVLLFVFTVWPIFYSFYLSLYQYFVIFPDRIRFIGLDNYAEFFKDAMALESLWRTCLFVVLTTLIEVAIGMGLALTMNLGFKGRNLLRSLLLIPWAIPTAVASIMWRFMLNDQYGVIRLFGRNIEVLSNPTTAFSAIILCDVWKTSAYIGLILLAGLQGIPSDTIEQAKIDGANAWQRFWKIIFPQLRPALMLALLFRTIDAFRVFDLVYVLTEGGPGNSTSVLQFYGYKKMMTENNMGYGTTISVVVFLLILSLSVFYLLMIKKRMAEQNA